MSEDQLMLLEQLLELDEGLTDWEVKFVDSIDKQRRAGRALSPGQAATLERIGEERLR